MSYWSFMQNCNLAVYLSFQLMHISYSNFHHIWSDIYIMLHIRHALILVTYLVHNYFHIFVENQQFWMILSDSSHHSLNFHSCRHIGQCCCTCWEFSHFRMQCMWKQWEHWPQTNGQSSPGTLQSGQQPLNAVRQMPQFSSFATQNQVAMAFQRFTFTRMAADGAVGKEGTWGSERGRREPGPRHRRLPLTGRPGPAARSLNPSRSSPHATISWAVRTDDFNFFKLNILSATGGKSSRGA